jgi:hypothetical protein
MVTTALKVIKYIAYLIKRSLLILDCSGYLGALLALVAIARIVSYLPSGNHKLFPKKMLDINRWPAFYLNLFNR